MCSSISAIVTTIATYPLNKLIYRQLLENKKISNVFAKIVREGPFLLYRGVLPPVTQKILDSSVMFGVFGTTRRYLKHFNLKPGLEVFLSGVVAGTFEATVMPFERIQVLLIHTKYQNDFKNTIDAFIKVGKRYGVKEYYRGFTVIWIRNIASCSSFFVGKAEIQKYFVMERRYSEGFKNFCIGGVLGGALAFLTYPLKVVKVNYHKNLGGSTPSISQMMFKIYQGEGAGKGINNLFKGVWLNAGRSLLNVGILNMTYEFCMSIL